MQLYHPLSQAIQPEAFSCAVGGASCGFGLGAGAAACGAGAGASPICLAAIRAT